MRIFLKDLCSLPTFSRCEMKILSCKYERQSRKANRSVSDPDMLPKILTRKQPSKMWELIAMNHIWATMESYPLDFAQSRLPPFIHHSCLLSSVSSSVKNFGNLPEPLVNCGGILPLHYQQSAGSRYLALLTTSQEVNRLNDEVR